MENKSLQVYVFNAGAGDHILLEFPDGSLGIIDCFFQGADLHLKELPALTYLKHLKAIREKKHRNEPLSIAFLCLSHADMDHLTGLDSLLDFIEEPANKVDLENLWLFGGTDIENYMNQLLTAFRMGITNLEGEQKEEIRLRIHNYKQRLVRLDSFVKSWRKQSPTKRTERYLSDVQLINKYGKPRDFTAYSFGPSPAELSEYDDKVGKVLIKTLLGNLQEFANTQAKDIEISYEGDLDRNAVSSILCIKYGNYKLIFGGDAGRQSWETSLSEVRTFGFANLLRPDFLKASHHGSKNSSSESMWKLLFTGDEPSDNNTIKKLYVGISAGKRHSHPNDEFYDDITKCCQDRNVNSSFHRTNECSKCYADHISQREMVWFDEMTERFEHPHASKILEVLENEGKSQYVPVLSCKRNLLAYIFEFPENGDNSNINVVRGVANRIGSYTDCVFKRRSKCFCPQE